MLQVSLHSRHTDQSATSHCSQPLVPGPLRERECVCVGGVLEVYADNRGNLAA